MIKSGYTPAVIFSLPDGYAPAQTSYFPVMTCGGYGDILVSSDGSVSSRTGSNACLSLNGVTFRAGS